MFENWKEIKVNKGMNKQPQPDSGVTVYLDPLGSLTPPGVKIPGVS